VRIGYFNYEMYFYLAMAAIPFDSFFNPLTPFIRIKMKGYAPCLSKSKAIGNKQQSSEAIA